MRIAFNYPVLETEDLIERRTRDEHVSEEQRVFATSIARNKQRPLRKEMHRYGARCSSDRWSQCGYRCLVMSRDDE